MNRYRLLLPGLLTLTLAGCADNVQAVIRDSYNVANEVTDHMAFVCDEDSALRFNELYTKRIKLKEDEIKERMERLKRQLVTNLDAKIFAARMLDLQTRELKDEIDAIAARYYKEIARTRRIIVKLTEDKVEENKPLDKTFTVDAAQVWPNLSALQKSVKLGEEIEGQGQGQAAMPDPMNMNPMGQAPPPDKNKLAFADISFSMHCERIVDAVGQKDWRISRRWKAGNTTVDKLEINGLNLVPLTSN
jgi:hypothetical protein